MIEAKIFPNPGSDEAVAMGCECARSDNHYGQGFVYGSAGLCFYINSECPIHGHKEEEDDLGTH